MKPEIVVAAGSGQIVAQGLRPADGILSVGNYRGPAARGVAADGIVAEGSDRSAAILADDGRPVEPVMILGQEAFVGVRDTDPVAFAVMGVTDRPAGPRHGEGRRDHPPEPVILGGDAFAAEAVEPRLSEWLAGIVSPGNRCLSRGLSTLEPLSREGSREAGDDA